VGAEVKALLGTPIKQAAAFAEHDWSGVFAILKREGSPFGIIFYVATLIGVKRDTLSKRLRRSDTSVHGSGPAPVVPPAVAQALSGVFKEHQLLKRAYPYKLALTGSLAVAAKLNLRPGKDVSPSHD
jgi:hypothetical protein